MIEVLHGVHPFEALAQAPGLLCEVEGTVGGERTILAATDATWEASEMGQVQVAWELPKDQYQLQASLPPEVTADIILPPEARAVWQSAPAAVPWPETLPVRGDAIIVVTPGQVEAR